jgi:hypothetical protein
MNATREPRHPNQEQREPLDEAAEFWRRVGIYIVNPGHAGVITAVATGMIFLSGLAYTLFSALQWSANEKAAVAAKSAAETAARQLELSERPWVGFEEDPSIEQSSSREDQFGFKITYRVKNFGQSAATDVVVFWDMFYRYEPSPPDIERGIRRSKNMDACKFADWELQKFSGGLLLPQGGRDDVYLEERPAMSVIHTGTFLIPGCIAYRDTFTRKIHHTWACYSVNLPPSSTFKNVMPCDAQYAD